jgi:hypothetical protein
VTVFDCFGTQDQLIKSADQIKIHLRGKKTNRTDGTNETNFKLEISDFRGVGKGRMGQMGRRGRRAEVGIPKWALRLCVKNSC